MYLDLDGSAEVVVNASLHALVALRALTWTRIPSSASIGTFVRGLYGAPGVT